MKPEQKSIKLLSATRAKSKMYEYNVPNQYHTDLPTDPARLMSLAIGMLGDYAAQISETPFEERLSQENSHLKFSAYYFEAYYQSKLLATTEPYIILLGAASYYLCDLPGSAYVLMGYLSDINLDFNSQEIEVLIASVLKGDNKLDSSAFMESILKKELVQLGQCIEKFRSTGQGERNMFDAAKSLKEKVYKRNSDRELLLVDILAALVRVMYENSCWRCLTEYSGLGADKWRSSIQKPSFIKELWPSQRLLGKAGVFHGNSAIIQMPTSAGKTRATEIIVRSAFLAKRTEIAIVVTPFRALCHEIRDALSKSFSGEQVSIQELSDVIQDDFSFSTEAESQQIFVVTPEKLVYILKQHEEFAKDVGLLVYDEGHQFDTGQRGVTFELLLTTLKSIVKNPQIILISAVLSNASKIGEWLVPEGAEIISGLGISPNFRSIAFSSWRDGLGELHFVNERDPSIDEFVVPRVIEPVSLGIKPGARKERLFPEKSNSNSVSLYLGLKLVANGGVAIFCGTKSTANALCKKAVELYRQITSVVPPATYSNELEVQRLTLLHELNLGTNENMTLAARVGIFNHHNNVPNGIRMAVEYSMRKRLTKFVLCTSTLSQGVNLPLKYLIVSGLQQGLEAMKARDFHNLIGRAGRSGIYTEGSIIFGNPDVYDNKRSRSEGWRWDQAINLLRPGSSEPCNSQLLTILNRFYNPKRRFFLDLDALTFCEAYVSGIDVLTAIPESMAATSAELTSIKMKVQEQVENKINIINSIESYLMTYAAESDSEGVAQLAKDTLAYHLASESEKSQMTKVFELLQSNIERTIVSASKRQIYGKTLFGLRRATAIDNWVNRNQENFEAAQSMQDLLDLIWPLIDESINTKIWNGLTSREPIRQFVAMWIAGESFEKLCQFLSQEKVEHKWGDNSRKLTVEQIVDLCQNSLAYQGSLAIGAIYSILSYATNDVSPSIRLLKVLQKNLQYGLPNQSSVILYEMGFSDRVVAIELSSVLGEVSTKIDVTDRLVRKANECKAVVARFPAYFDYVLADYIQ